MASIEMTSLIAQAIDGIEVGGAYRRVRAENKSDAGRERDRYRDDGQPCERNDGADHLCNGEMDHDLRKPDAKDQTDQPTDATQQQRFGEELQRDIAPCRADRLADADLARALADRDEHDVHDAYTAD